MTPPTTSINSAYVKVQWTQPYTHATKPITAYQITVLESGGLYITDASCDGSDSTIMS